MSEFKREDRYIVIKRSDLKKVPVSYRSSLVEPMFSLLSHLPRRECLVIESDWPEYESYWQMIERRMTGQPPVTAAEELEAVQHWRGKHALAVRERDALQQRLNAADQRIDELTAQQAESRMITLSGCEFSEHELLRTAVRMVTGTSRRGTLRWVAMKDAFCCGSGVAHALCRRFGFDPDETVKP
ncbi:hypothetical protein [Pseudomonas sp. NFACC13-1]|uniref:hypothetical protein n=1 Tax=Pseudomonas sp. NFACC13-1 TaxID=1566245 RepID=UPI00088B5DF3|nr:hypothetical protein [Pseudomonas sp. NFACC13-1]SDB54121.1 hypothetical protein SAMN03159290_04158 [Pseudomonas sp. NFACC13-1]